MDNKKNKGGRNPKLDPATNRYSVNFSSEEDMRLSHFSERRAMALVCKLEKCMMQFVQIMHEVIELTNRYEKRLIGKDN